ncbi:MAG: UPF0175 family protein [Thermoanaerobaculia bacterium]
MSEITMILPDNAATALHVQPEEVGNELRMAAAMKLYELGRISSGIAAELAGIPRTLFLTKLGEYGVTHSFTEDELRREAGIG